MSSLFISYSHNDENVVRNMEKHFSMLIRDNLLTAWHDKEILPGALIDKVVFDELEQSNLFLAVVSPDYLASNYCYEKEFKRALEKQKSSELTILPVIAEHCDWKNSPLGQFKALPKDGKPISDWLQPNAAYQYITEELRRLLKTTNKNAGNTRDTRQSVVPTRNYKIKRDFTAIDKLNFKEETFREIKAYFTVALNEVDSLEDIQARFSKKDEKSFNAIITNRKKSSSTGYISVTIEAGDHFSFKGDLNYSLSENQNGNSIELDKVFNISHDDYEQFWTVSARFYPSSDNRRLNARSIAEILWDAFIKQVGLSY